MKAVVLAAGKGTRMLPLTKDIPKHMILVNGRPFIEYIIDSLRSAGIDEIAFIVSYKRDILEAYLKTIHPNVAVIDQGEPKGTGHAVLAAKEFVGGNDFVVMMGDNLYSAEDVRAVSNAKGNTIAGLEVADPSKYGVLVVNGTKLVSIVEKPKEPPSKMINTGLYKFTLEIFDALSDVKLSPRGEYEIVDAINALAKRGRMGFYRLKDYWLDFGKPEDVKKVEEFLRSKR